MRARFNVKLFVQDPARVAASDFIPVFHRLIQEGALDELMIDVANYSHVHHGPGVMLVCHEAHYAMDQGEGRLGLYYERKRRGPDDVRASLDDALRRAFAAASALERDPTLRDRLRFGTDEILIGIRDRLNAANTPETFRALEPILLERIRHAFGVEPELEHLDDPRQCFCVRIRAPGAPPLESILARLRREG